MAAARRHLPLVLGLLGVIALFMLLATLRLSSAPDARYMQSLGLVELPHKQSLALPPLQDHRGAAFDAARLQDGWSLLFFGFSNCPDVCPTTMSLLGRLARNLEHDRLGRDTRFVMISVDPERDDAEQLRRFLAQFHPALLGVRGELKDIRALAATFGVAFNKKPHPKLLYDMVHSANVFFVSPDGHWLGFARPPHSLENLERGYRTLRKRYETAASAG